MKLLIVNFHYYSDQQFQSGIYPVTPSFFAKQIDILSQHYSFISQAELAQYIENKQYPDGNYCLLTFDDGLKQQMDAFRYLVQQNIPAVFYVPVKPLIEKKVLDVHKLHLVRAKIDDKKLLDMLTSTTNYQYNVEDATEAKEQYKYDDDLAREVKYQLNFKLNPSDKELFISNAFQEIYPDEAAFADTFYMSEQDVVDISRWDMLGSHGYAHIPLAQAENPYDDMHQSIHYLSELTGQAITSFSYPYGSKAAVNEAVAAHLENSSIRFALTMWRGTNDFTQAINPFLLQRVDTNDAPGGKNYSNTSL